MKSATVILSFVCVVALVQSCYGLKCFKCDSINKNSPKCDKLLNDSYLKVIPGAEICILTYTKLTIFGVEVYTRTERDGVKKTKINEIENENKLLRTLGYDIYFNKCTTDKCNGGQPKGDEVVTKIK